MNVPFAFPPLPGASEIPVWTGQGFRVGAATVPVLEYSENSAGWNDELTTLHVEAAGSNHPIDKASRRRTLSMLKTHLGGTEPTILEVGVSEGTLVRELKEHFPEAFCMGADITKAHLYALAKQCPDLPLLRFDLTQCPLSNASVNAVICLNVLEHIENDELALSQIARILKPAGIAIVEVPAGPSLYDSYDKELLHFRRYSMNELLAKAQKAGFKVLEKNHIGALCYPAFALVKLKNRFFAPKTSQVSVVHEQAVKTSESKVLEQSFLLEEKLSPKVYLPFGIRCHNVLQVTSAERERERERERDGKKWPKQFTELSSEQKAINDDFVRYWHEVLPKNYGIIDTFNHGYPVKQRQNVLGPTLEIGAGTGEHLYYEKLSEEAVKNYVALDIRQNMLDKLQEDFPGVQTLLADCQERLPFGDGHFKRIIAIHVLEHLCNLPKAIQELRRVCAADGQLCIVIPCEGSLAYSLAREISAKRIFEKRYKQSYQWFIEREHVNKPEEILQEVEKYFVLKHRTFFPLPFMPLVACNLCIGMTFEPVTEGAKVT